MQLELRLSLRSQYVTVHRKRMPMLRTKRRAHKDLCLHTRSVKAPSQQWCNGVLLFRVLWRRFLTTLIGSVHTEISKLWTSWMNLAYCEPPPDTQRWRDGALLLRVRRRRFLSALLLVLSARGRFLYSVAYYDLRLKRSSSGRCWAARAKRLLCYWILEIQVSAFGTSPNMPNMHMNTYYIPW